METLEESLKRLTLPTLSERLEGWLETAVKQEWTHRELLEKIVAEEVSGKHHKRSEMGVRMARFTFVKTLDGFDFTAQPSLDPKRVRELAVCRWVGNRDNVVLLGPPGVGKTHLSVALGVEAIRNGYRTLFVGAQALIAGLVKAHQEGRLDEKLKQLSQFKLLTVDEIGYIPIDRMGANLFFQLISRRYDKGSMILTSNQTYANWGEIFGDPVIASAILDRVLHHASTLNIKGESYRLKEKRKAGLLSRLGEEVAKTEAV